MIRLEQEGIFKARPLSWTVRKSDHTKSVGVNIKFKIVASLDGEAWLGWEGVAEDHEVYGTYYVVGKLGKVNMNACEQLVTSMGWDGSLDSIVAGPPPECVVQIEVKAETYEGETRYKAGWMNPEDHVPGSGGLGGSEVADLNKSYGSLLRGAAASIAKAKPKAAAPPAAPPTPPAESKPVSTLPTAAEAPTSLPATQGMTQQEIDDFDAQIPFK